MKALLPILLIVALCVGCTTTVAVRKPPKVDLTRFHRIFVEQPLNENHHLDEIMADELRALGRESSSGPLTMMPENTDAVLTYTASWSGDFRTYLLDLHVTLHTPDGNKLLAEGRYYQPSITTKPPEVVVHQLLGKLFAK